jgi:Plasmid pRiA4b ORF-3-like protein
LALAELKAIQQKAERALRHASTGMVRNFLRHVIDCTGKAIDRSQGVGSIPATERLYQLKITLLDTRPSVWRRIQVKDGPLDKLHEHIQTATGWTNSHLHHFIVGANYYGDPMLLHGGPGDLSYEDSTATKLSDILPKTGKRFRFGYEYDFGDSWRHQVLFEGCLRAEPGGRFPLCLDGERACPPEDVGGTWGYEEFLAALADPQHERHRECREWVGRSFDPEAFDAAKATKRMRRGLPDWREMA